MMRSFRFMPDFGSSKRIFLRLLLTFLTLLALLPGTPALAQIVPDEGALMAPPPTEPGEEPAYNDAFYVSQSVSTTMAPNSVHTVTVTMENRGSTTWTSSSGYALGSQSPQDNSTWGLSRVPLPVSILPGETATFSFQVRAPSVTGTYPFRWRMLQENVQWFGSYSPELIVTVRDPINNAQPVGQSVPATMETGKPYNVSVTMKNNGETTWNRAQEYTLMAQSPHNNTTWGFNRVPLPVDNIAPGQSVTFNFQVTEPTTAGGHIFQWGMQRERYGSFGPGTTPVTVTVAAPFANNAQLVSIVAPATMVSGKSYDVAVTMRNTGTTTWDKTNYRLGCRTWTDVSLWGICRIALTASVAPGQQYTFRFAVTAPAAGTHTMKWGMLQTNVGSWYGSEAAATVTVTEDLSNVTFIHTDGLGSPVARTDGTGAVLSRTRYEPYGYVASGATPTIGFTGHVNDADTGLTYMQQRYYDPVAGRFLSVDPVSTDANTGGSFSRYTYANNNPYAYVDPDGRMGKLISTVIKVVAKGGDVGSTVAGLVDNARTIASPTASWGSKVFAAADIALDVVTGVNSKDIKAGAAAIESVADMAKKAPDFDTARNASFKNAGMTDPSTVQFSKFDEKTGTVVEFKGAGGAKVGYDGPHQSPGPHHDTQHISWQSAGKRDSGSAQRGNEPYSGPQHPSRPDRKDQ